MTRVVAIILHPVPRAGAGPLEMAFGRAREESAVRQARGFEAVGADARIVEVEPAGAPFGRRLRELARVGAGGIVVFGSGSIPLAGAADRAAFVAAASTPGGPVLVNNRYSADVVAIPASVDLSDLPDLPGDNGVPRWLAGRGVEVRDLRGRRRLQVDLDSPIDLLVAGLAGSADPAFDRVRAARLAIRARADDPCAEVVVAGRTSAGTLRWLETRTASRTRALVEERGMRTAGPAQRRPSSAVGLLLDRAGPSALGRLLAELGDAAVVDTRVLLAHRTGADERAWPAAEDRFASDLLLPERIADSWLRELTAAAAEAPIPILLGGHTLVGPGLPYLLGGRR